MRSARTLVVDIGGSGIKGMVLDSKGAPLTARVRFKTPQPATPDRVIGVTTRLARKVGPFDRISVGFPGVVRAGVVETAPNLDPSWEGQPLEKLLHERFGKPARTANDATVHGLSVIASKGVELVITLGTGFGSALFIDGRPLPNLELGHHPFRSGKSYEELLGNAGLRNHGKAEWNKALRRAIREIRDLFHPDTLFLGGGNARKIKGELPNGVRIVPNKAGLLGGVRLWGY
jgi:polyphosphate glucokinase